MKKETDKQESLERAHQKLQQLSRDAFFGRVEISFQNGKVHVMTVNQTFRMEDL